MAEEELSSPSDTPENVTQEMRESFNCSLKKSNETILTQNDETTHTSILPEFVESSVNLSKCDVGIEERVELERKNAILESDVAEESHQIEKTENFPFQLKEKSGTFDGLLPKLVKSGSDNPNLKNFSLKIEVVDGTALVDVVKLAEKRNKRKGKKGNNPISCGKRRTMYSRKKLEFLRFVNVNGQKKFWQEVYDGFDESVRKEYDELSKFCHLQIASVANSHGHGLLGESTSETENCEAETIGALDATCDNHNVRKDGNEYSGEWSEEEESDEEYDSIQRPAFQVEGEPDFESGPPEDGLEYLRRVRWEAAQMPQVKVARVDNAKFNKDQSVYMPKIPDIEKYPPHLVPQQQWEEVFVSEFSQLRLALLRLENATSDSEPQSIIFHHKESTSRSSENLASLKLPSGGPTLSAILEMDPLTRITMVKKRISLFDSTDGFSKDDCSWLFALCAAVDVPLDADTCASLRCLLRRCAKLRATKSELDDEVIMLNILTTIAGKFFGQLEG